MVLKDFGCDSCGAFVTDVWAPSGPARPVCACGRLMDVVYPPRLGVDALPAFDVEVNGVTHHVTSLAQARQIERAAEQATRNGEGQPFIFRSLSQDHSNMDRNVFGEPPHPKFQTRSRSGLPFTTRRSS